MDLETCKRKLIDELLAHEKDELKKSCAYQIDRIISKSRGFSVGTVRVWNGQKHRKVAPGKWVPVYDGDGRAASQSSAHVARQIEAAKDFKELGEIVSQNLRRFTVGGKLLPVARVVLDAAKKRQGELRGREKYYSTRDGVKPETERKKELKAANEADKKLIENLGTSEERKTLLRAYIRQLPGSMEEKQDALHALCDGSVLDDICDRIVRGERPVKGRGRGKNISYFWEGTDKDGKPFDGGPIDKKAAKFAMTMYRNKNKVMELMGKAAVRSNDGYPEKDYPEYKGKGQSAIDFLVRNKGGQVKGAFHREEIGDIDVVWGEITNAEKHEGYGLSHIIDKHGEGITSKLGDVIENGSFSTNSSNGRASITKDGFKVAIRRSYNGNKKTWIVTGFKENNGTSTIPSSAKNYTAKTSPKPSASNIPQSSPSVKRKLLDTFEWNGAGNGREESYSGDTEKFIRQQVKEAIEKKDVDALYYMLKSKDRYMNARLAVLYARRCFNESEGEDGISFPRAHWTSWEYEDGDLEAALKKWAGKKKSESRKVKKSCAERINELKKAVFAGMGETA